MKENLFVQYPKCSTCIKAKKWLENNNIQFESRDITKHNPTEEELTLWIKKSDLSIQKFFNTSGKIYKEENLKDKVKSSPEDELIRILASNGMVVKRPLLITENCVLVGFNEKEWSEKLK